MCGTLVFKGYESLILLPTIFILYYTNTTCFVYRYCDDFAQYFLLIYKIIIIPSHTIQYNTMYTRNICVYIIWVYIFWYSKFYLFTLELLLLSTGLMRDRHCRHYTLYQQILYMNYLYLYFWYTQQNFRFYEITNKFDRIKYTKKG